MPSPAAPVARARRRFGIRVRAWGLAALVAGAARCGGADRAPLEQGRTYTTWLYTSQYDKLWDRFSPEMRRTFGSAADLAAFAGRSVRRLGPERGRADERVADAGPDRVYTRTASFRGAPRPMVIQWSLGRDGAVTGLVVRPAVPDSTAPPR